MSLLVFLGKLVVKFLQEFLVFWIYSEGFPKRIFEIFVSKIAAEKRWKIPTSSCRGIPWKILGEWRNSPGNNAVGISE